MAKAGRKRKTGQREPSGRIQRPTTMEALNAITRQEALRVKTVVLMQPHRRDSEDPESKLNESALGRFCLKVKCRAAFDVGRKYADLVNSWRAAHDLEKRQLLEDLPSGGLGLGPSRATTDRWRAQIESVEAALTRASFATRIAVTRLVIDDVDLAHHHAEMDALLGLRIVAIELGMLEKDHPFR